MAANTEPGPVTVSAGGASITAQLFDRIRDDILNGVLQPGLKLKIETLRESYEVGASPVREALSMLTAEGLVQRLDQRGFRVSEISVSAFEELLRTRCWLEERALRESIASRSAAWDEGVLLAHHRLTRTPRSQSGSDKASPQWEKAHKLFHMSLLSSCGSGFLIGFCEQLYDLNIRYRNIAGAIAYPSRNVAAEHQAICEAAIAHEADEAVKLLVDHYTSTGEFLKMRLNTLSD
ncbi:GntR family transcriptional regulator [Hoeflea prorocentri]|uniref:GntR family transcriptional regulator n=1 Tax=Hoeflea prorocentri TaxID=1922333 RepID=A0A9X3UJJ5_9HYPH|nr:GntR family transcriptional regulator [Hoeflea prorocentri]MCY6381985.1 GntR family transcriptional regulator [Hoeflea prorocentri]MDA5399785.1 GntR family transcriptional regulator [Hoeflea prorocentri]